MIRTEPDICNLDISQSLFSNKWKTREANSFPFIFNMVQLRTFLGKFGFGFGGVFCDRNGHIQQAY